MNVEEIREFCLSFVGATESFPFDDTTLVFKVAGKMFALLSLEDDKSVSLKCDPERAMRLREHYPAIRPARYMSKKYWIMVGYDRVRDDELKDWIAHSYDEVVAKLPRKDREQLEEKE